MKLRLFATIGYVKEVRKRLQESGKSEEEVKDFEKKISTYLKETVLKNFADYEFYTGEGMNPDGMVALLNYR